jgi:hypothetical protein
VTLAARERGGLPPYEQRDLAKFIQEHRTPCDPETATCRRLPFACGSAWIDSRPRCVRGPAGMGAAGLRRIAPVAARHVHPLTGEGIVYALWRAELLAEAFRQGDPHLYDNLWRKRYGRGLMATSDMLRPLNPDI